jgi:hypothetical protein
MAYVWLDDRNSPCSSGPNISMLELNFYTIPLKLLLVNKCSIWIVGKEKLLWGFQILPKKIKTLIGYFLKSCCNFNTRNPTLATISHMHLINVILMKAMDCGVVKNNGQYLESLMQTMTWSPGLNLWLGGFPICIIDFLRDHAIIRTDIWWVETTHLFLCHVTQNVFCSA